MTSQNDDLRGLVLCGNLNWKWIFQHHLIEFMWIFEQIGDEFTKTKIKRRYYYLQKNLFVFVINR